MPISRLHLIRCAAATLMIALHAGSHATGAQDYPARPIRLIVPYAAGQGADVAARLVGARLATSLGQPVIVDNKAGAGGNIGAEAVVRAAPDGYTLLWGSNATNAANRSLYRNLGFDPQRDLIPVSLMTRVQMVIAVRSGDRRTDMASLLADAKANPGKTDVAVPSTTSRVVVAELQRAAGVELYPVLYKSSGSAMTDLIGGQLSVIVDTLTASLPLIRSGKIKPLAVTLGHRSQALPEVPTVAEAGLKDFDLGPWNVIAAPRGTPPAVVDMLNARLKVIMAEPDIRQRMRDLTGDMPGAEPALTPAQVQAFVARETETWGRIIRAANISAD